jgi:hypothetical protein
MLSKAVEQDKLADKLKKKQKDKTPIASTGMQLVWV